MTRLITLLSIILLLLMPLSALSKGLGLSDANYIHIQTYTENNKLIVYLQYVNMDSDEHLFWEDGEVTCSYVIYKTDSSISSNKIKEVSRGEKILTKSSQRIYLDVFNEMEHNAWYIIECEVDTGYRNLTAKTTFPIVK